LNGAISFNIQRRWLRRSWSDAEDETAIKYRNGSRWGQEVLCPQFSKPASPAPPHSPHCACIYGNTSNICPKH